MFVPFDQLPDDSRIWIYQADRKFSDEEFAAIDIAARAFVDGWMAHGKPLEASYELKYNRFIVLAVNLEVEPVSGCSVDESVHFIQDLEKQYGVQLLDKMNVTFRQSGHIAHKTLADFRKMAKDKSVSGDTIVFNNLVNTVGEYREFWEVPAAESWHSRFF
jgi:hypothetical protein